MVEQLNGRSHGAGNTVSRAGGVDDDRPIDEAEEHNVLGLPWGERIELPGRGKTFFRRVEGPPGAPTVLLLHGWVASGGMNYFNAFDDLSKHFNIVAPDMRGHGRGIRSWRRFRLTDCADDAAALIEHLGCGPVIAVGYSMGGPVAAATVEAAPRAGVRAGTRRHRQLVGARPASADRTGRSRLGGRRAAAPHLGAAQVGAKADPDRPERVEALHDATVGLRGDATP